MFCLMLRTSSLSSIRVLYCRPQPNRSRMQWENGSTEVIGSNWQSRSVPTASSLSIAIRLLYLRSR